MRHILQIGGFFLGMSLFGSAAQAGPLSPQLPKDYFSKEPPSSQNLLVTGVYLGYFHVLFEDTTLATVIQTVAKSDISHQGDGAESSYSVCYTLTNPKMRGRVWFISNEEMDGPEQRISVVDAILDESAVPLDDCPALPQKYEQLSFDGNISLGMTGNAVINVLGPIFRKDKDWVHYLYKGKIPGACLPDPGDILNYISFKRSGSTVKQIVAGQTTSC